MPSPARPRRAALVALAATLGALLVTVAPATWADPVEPAANDDLADAAPIQLGETLDADTAGGTLEEGETQPAPVACRISHSLWYVYDATTAGSVAVGTLAPEPRDTAIAVYTADTPGQYPLTPVTCADEGFTGSLSRATFTAAAGTRYYVQVGQYGGTNSTAPGPIQVRLATERTTTTTLEVTSPSPGRVGFEITVARPDGVDPTGSVVVREGATPVAQLPVVDGAASGEVGATAGSHTYTARFDPAILDESSSTSPPDTVTVGPPVNDDLADATILTGLSGSAGVTGLDGATHESTDPALAPSLTGATAWFTWTAPVSDTYRFTIGSTEPDADPVLGVLLRRGPETFEVLRTAGLGGGPGETLAFPAVGGRTYHLLLDAARRGPTSLAWSRGFPTADSTTTLAVASPGQGAVTLTSTSTLVSDDPDDARGPDGTAAFYRGTTLLGLAPVGPDGGATWDVARQPSGSVGYSVEYYPAAAAVRPSVGQQAFALAPPANDQFANATDLGATNGTTGISGTTSGATPDAGTPAPRELAAPGAGTTVWYRWTAPTSGPVTFTTTSTGDRDTVLRSFTGTTLTALRRLAENDDVGDDERLSRVGINARAGQTYYLLVDAYRDGDVAKTGPFTLTWGASSYDSSLTAPTPALTSSVSGRTVTLSATVTKPASLAKEGQVELTENGALRGVVPVGSGGLARLVLTNVTPGQHRYRAVFVPNDARVAPATSGERVVTVARPTRTVLTAPGRARSNSRPQIDVMVTSGDVFASGSVRISVNGRAIATRRLDVGIVILTLPRLPIGRVRLDAVYLGTAQYARSSATRYVTVSR